jgi:hypothetical protein
VSSPAAWHPDPSGAHEHRYWDGERWTDHVADAGVASTDPLPAAPGAPRSDVTADEVRADEVRGDEPRGDELRGDELRGDEVPDGAPDDRASGDDGSGDTAVLGGTAPGDATGSQPGPPTGAPIGGTDAPPSPQGGTWGTSAGSGSGGQPPAWAGQASQGPSWGGSAGASTSTGMATTALVLGIVSLPMLIFFGLGALLGIAAVVVGIIAVRRTNRGEASGRGMAIGGIVTGAISVVLGILIVIALFAFGFGFAGELERCIEETGSQAICQERLERELTERFLGE